MITYVYILPLLHIDIPMYEPVLFSFSLRDFLGNQSSLSNTYVAFLSSFFQPARGGAGHRTDAWGAMVSAGSTGDLDYCNGSCAGVQEVDCSKRNLFCSSVDGNQKSGVHQLRLAVYPVIYGDLNIPGGCLGFLPSTVWEAFWEWYFPISQGSLNFCFPFMEF